MNKDNATQPSNTQDSSEVNSFLTAITELSDTTNLPQPYDTPILSATYKQEPSDFKVNEIMDITLDGEGEHLWMQVCKSGMNTLYVAELLSKWAKIPLRDVGFSGLKDRQAVTTQWYSLRIPKKTMPDTTFESFLVEYRNNQQHVKDESVTVLTQNWHGKKLNRGTHRANHFEIILKDLVFDKTVFDETPSNKTTMPVTSIQNILDQLLVKISQQGVPNYFGPQRFGRQGNNIKQVVHWFNSGLINNQKPSSKKNRETKSLLLSTARSVIFNQILAKRVRDQTWNKGLDGEVFNLEGSSSIFGTEKMDKVLIERLKQGDIHPTAPLWGIGNSKVVGEAKQIEDSIIHNHDVLRLLAKGLEDNKVKSMRRSLRLPVANLKWQLLTDNQLKISFDLVSGSFATSVLSSLVASLNE